MDKVSEKVINLADFVAQNDDAKSQVMTLIKHLVREVRKQHLSYHQLKYIFRVVRSRCDIKAKGTPRRLIELPTNEELEGFFSAMKNPVHRLIFQFLLGTGLRVSEMCSLEISRMDLKTNQAFVYKGKGQKDRIALYGCRIRDQLELYLQGRQNKYLFESARHTRYSSRRIEQLCENYKTAASIEKRLTPHTLRHVWNTRLAEKGIDRERRALLAGHDSIDTQEIYTHLAVGGFKGDVIKILDE